ncbi:Citrinin biosynthesis transcriptional activator mrl3-like protein [Cladobotryum mycophilum]|uniref:Citrinin biosynthesis transcriptional activator mrl3-like protein n=1 Tax=Cladobotryum mycophilum TaxID=491253 RepID=A0ABR0SAA4_9HYPO
MSTYDQDDLPQQQQPEASAASSSSATEPLACVSCRSRKLKCDRTKPACTRCVKVKNECVYPESRRKPTFKRRNVKELEARLAQVEDYLNQVNKTNEEVKVDPAVLLDEAEVPMSNFTFRPDTTSPEANTSGASDPPLSFDIPSFTTQDDGFFGSGFSGQLMGLGMSEALPPFEVMEELNNYFFETHYHYLPIVHQGRYFQAFYGPPMRKPPMCLQYAIWAISASGHVKYDSYADVFYKRARQYTEADEMKGDGEHFITIAHAQAWAIIANYEAKCMLFTRACMSSARTSRLIHMMGLDRLDKEGDDIPPTLGPITSWTELEERRRVFWGAFAIDAHASISTGWPSLIKTEEIITRLPASEEAFALGQEEKTVFLEEVFQGASFGGFSGAIVICQIFKTILRHIHGAKPSDHAEDLMHGEFWRRHRDLDNQLSSLFMFLPDSMRLPQNVRDPSAVHTNLNLHASIICLHHAALEMAEKHNLPDTVKHVGRTRLRTAAEEIVNIIKITSHHTTLFKSQLCALSLYCATTVYVYLAKDDPVSGLSPVDISNLKIVISAMEAIGRVHMLTCAFLQQACLDIERNNLSAHIQLPSLAKYRNLFGGPSSHIPLLARSPVSRHTEAATPLPGRLPLERPKGVPRPSTLKMTKGQPSFTGLGPVDRAIKGHTQSECFQPVLGAATRNVAPIVSEAANHKRKRMSPSPGPGASVAGGFNVPNHVASSSGSLGGHLGVGVWRTGDMSQMLDGAFNLPDRTNSSASSPAQRGATTETLSASSHTSPSLGLGNTPEENRIDLRQFQARIVAPLWETTEGGVFERLTETFGTFANDGSDAWTILDGKLNWTDEGPPGNQ